MSNPTVDTMIRATLLVQGYGGLYNTTEGCGCMADDIAPCGEIKWDCQAGYVVSGDGPRCDYCPGCTFHVVADSPTDQAEGRP